MKRILFALVVIGWLAPWAVAHHSGALYELTKTNSVQGTVKAFHWINPHVILLLSPETKDHDANEWRFELTSPSRLARAGWNKRLLNSGDKLTVEFNPMRDGSKVGWVRKITLSDGKVLVFSPQGEDQP